MSIRGKLSFAISLIVFVVLLLNITFAQINARAVQRENIEQQITTMTNQLALSIELIETTNLHIEQELAMRLKTAAQAAEKLLPPSIEDVTLELLTEVRDELHLTDITLWVSEDNELVSPISTNAAEINLRSKTWDYWDVAMKQVFSLQPVTVSQGEYSTHFYSGPLNFAVTDPSAINKWGYYYSGKTNYMINTVLNTDQSFPNGYINSKEKIVDQLIANNRLLVEITAFDPQFFGKEKIIKLKQGKPVYNLDVRDVKFGEYEYINEDDASLVQAALTSTSFLSSKFEFDDSRFIRTFIPIIAEHPYVISMVFDYDKLLESTNKQLHDHTIISIILLLLTVISSYHIAKLLTTPLTKIMGKVNAIAMKQFNTPLELNRNDELGLLADHVNTMGDHLYRYTEQLKQTNVELQKTKQYLESFVTHTKEAIHIMDLNFNIIQVNKAFEEMFQYDSSELIGKPLFPNDPEQQRSYEKLLIGVMNNNGPSSYETIMYTRSGTALDVSSSLSAITNEHGETVAVASITRNITQYKQNEQLRRNNEKLEAMGQLAASIAHEIRNPLTTVKGFLALNRSAGQISEEHMELVMQEIEHMNLIVSQFLSMSRPQIEQWESIQVDRLLGDIVTLMTSAGKLKEEVDVYIQCSTQQTKVMGSEQHLKQVFVNLIKNSVEAMPQGGRLCIDIQQATQDKQLIITLEDTGIGMDEEALKHIFTPFYTNKQDGNGLGLLVSQQIIANHHGCISFASQVGQGTTVTVKLPIVLSETT